MAVLIAVTVFIRVYNPGQKVLGHLTFFTCFCMEFAANLQYTLLNTALTRFSPPHHPLPNKVEVLNVCKICKKLFDL